ncbi:MAG TPA: hypothetical protein PLL76_22690, partial [Thermoanaerobaculia bacterium]|nr:hypothetical protein [Thermoanaerobaculia bacterium]
MTKNSFRGLSLGACLALLLSTPSAIAALYTPIEDAELLRRSETVVLARAGGSTVLAGPGSLPETRTAFDVIDTLAGSGVPLVEVAVPGGELSGGPTLVLDGVPRFSPGALYVLALRIRGDGVMVPTELGLGVFDVVRDEAGRDYATRAMFRSERVATRFREADGSLVERPEPLRDLAGFTSWVRAGLFREEALPGVPAWIVARETGELTQVKRGGVTAMWDDHWCPGGVPGSCGSSFVRYRWVEPKASVRWCDEDPTTNGQGAVLMGGTAQFKNAVDLWTNDAGSSVAYTVDGAMTGTCNPAAIPA